MCVRVCVCARTYVHVACVCTCVCACGKNNLMVELPSYAINQEWVSQLRRLSVLRRLERRTSLKVFAFLRVFPKLFSYRKVSGELLRGPITVSGINYFHSRRFEHA